jgi:hypothetical protein
MPATLRAILAVVAGLVVGFAVVMAVEMISTMIFPLPEGVDPMDEAAMREIMADIPTGALVLVLFAWLLGTTAGVATAIRLHPGRERWPGFVVAGLLAVATGANLLMLPHPLWMAVAAPVALIVGLLAGLRLGGGPSGVGHQPPRASDGA